MTPMFIFFGERGTWTFVGSCSSPHLPLSRSCISALERTILYPNAIYKQKESSFPTNFKSNGIFEFRSPRLQMDQVLLNTPPVFPELNRIYSDIRRRQNVEGHPSETTSTHNTLASLPLLTSWFQLNAPIANNSTFNRTVESKLWDFVCFITFFR